MSDIGIIFDMDGVISDTQKIHAKVQSEILNKHGIEISPKEITKRFSGRKSCIFFQELLDKKEIKANIDILETELWKKTYSETENKAEAMPGALELINSLSNKKIPLAIASSSPLKYIDVVLNKLNIKNKFQIITSAREVKNGKPEPDVFLLAAQRMKIAPQNCLVIEDGISGMIGAQKAKMKCIGLVYDQEKYPVDLTVNNLKEINIEKILKLFV